MLKFLKPTKCYAIWRRLLSTETFTQQLLKSSCAVYLVYVYRSPCHAILMPLALSGLSAQQADGASSIGRLLIRPSARATARPQAEGGAFSASPRQRKRRPKLPLCWPSGRKEKEGKAPLLLAARARERWRERAAMARKNTV